MCGGEWLLATSAKQQDSRAADTRVQDVSLCLDMSPVLHSFLHSLSECAVPGAESSGEWERRESAPVGWGGVGGGRQDNTRNVPRSTTGDCLEICCKVRLTFLVPTKERSCFVLGPRVCSFEGAPCCFPAGTPRKSAAGA